MSAWLYGDNFQRWYDNGEAHIAEHVWEIGEVPQTVRTFGSVGGEGDQGALDVFLNGGKGVWHVEPQHRRARWSKRVSERWAHITVEIVGKFGWRDGQSDWTQIICQYVGSVELQYSRELMNRLPVAFLSRRELGRADDLETYDLASMVNYGHVIHPYSPCLSMRPVCMSLFYQVSPFLADKQRRYLR